MELLQFLTIAPTPILAIVLIALWKIDRRLLKVETVLDRHWHGNGGNNRKPVSKP